jgi:membrane-bound metal-dependent hydrolase YbcI (DUF457 family)
MMGRSHAWTGALVGSAVAAGLRLNLLDTTIAVAVCAGSALLPDLDHKNSVASNSFGPISRSFAWAVRTVTGGHRRATHSLLGCLLATGVVQLGLSVGSAALPAVRRFEFDRSTAWAGLAGLAVVVWVLILVFAGVIRLTIGHPPGWLDDLAPIPLAVGVAYLGGSLPWLPAVVGAGCVVHIVGDMLTPEGCPLLWPFTDRHYALGLFTTNTWPERWLVTPTAVAGTALLLADHAGLARVWNP